MVEVLVLAASVLLHRQPPQSLDHVHSARGWLRYKAAFSATVKRFMSDRTHESDSFVTILAMFSDCLLTTARLNIGWIPQYAEDNFYWSVSTV